MPPARKLGVAERVDDLFGNAHTDYARTKTQNVRIVVLARHSGRERVSAEGCTNARMTIGRHAHADAAAAHQHAERMRA